MSAQPESESRYYHDHDLVVFVGHSEDAREEGKAIKSLVHPIQGELNKLNRIAGPSSRFKVVKIFLWEYDALSDVGGQERTISPHLDRSNIAVFVFRERVGRVTWQELTACRQRDENRIPLIALFPNKSPEPERMTTQAVAEGWLDLLKKREELFAEWTKADSRSVLPTDLYGDHQDLKRIVLEKITAEIFDLLRYVTPQKGKPSFLADLPLPAIDTPFIDQLTPVFDYDSEAVRLYRAQLKDEAKTEFPDSLADADFLVKAGYRDNRGFLTRAGVLLFSNNPQGLMASAISRYIVYEGVTKDSARAPQDISGPIYSQILKVFELVKQRTEKREIPIRGLVAAQTFYQYPVTCLREIIANALVHRRYDDPDRMIHIRAFSDRIEVVSPGSWSAGKRLSEIPIGLSKLEGESVKRNFRLVQAVGAIKLVEGEGSGIPTGLRDCSEIGAPEPTVAEKDGSVVVTVFPRRDWSQFVKSIALEAEGAGGSLTTPEHRTGIDRQNVFISASADLGSYRQVVRESLLTLGANPIEETNLPTEYRELWALLTRRLDHCDAVIHLVGFAYGAEPQRPLDAPRRSFTQLEYHVARKQKKPIYLFLAVEGSEFDELPEQGDEERALQLAHRQAIEEGGDAFYSFANRENLARAVRELKLPARRSEVPRRVVNLPYESLGPLFKGRDTALAELRQRLGFGGKSAIGLTARQAIHGLGGVGKTRLAVEYAWRHASEYTALLFISARSPVDLRANLAELGNPSVLNLPEWNQPEEIIRLAAVFRWLSEHSGWLLTLDNVDTPEAAAEVEKTLPRLQGGRVIITSRIADWSSAVQPVELDVLAEEDSAAFLLEHTESRRKKMLTDKEDAAALARDLGGLALALEQAGTYVAKKRVSFLEYRRRWEARKEEVLAWHDERLMIYPKSVATTWQTAIEELSQPERKLLNILAWLAPAPIPLSLLEGNIVDGTDARDCLAGLASWSLARWVADEEEFTVHRLVQEITRQRLSDNEKQNTLEAAVAVLDNALPSPEWDQKGWRLWEKLAPHCRTLFNRLRGHPLEPKATRTMNQLAFWLNNRAEYGEAESLFRRALAIDEKSFGPDHPNVARGLNNLASLLRDTNRLAEAEPLYERALAITEKSFGQDHLNVAIGLNNLASLLRDTNRHAEVEPLYRRALAITEKSFGPDHPNAAIGLNNLAGLFRDTDRHAEAEPLYRRSLAITERTFGPDHPNVAIGLNNLASLLRATNRHAEAEPLFRRALAITEKSFGPGHPNVATGLNNLGLLLRDTSRLAEAEPLFRRSLTITEKSFGPDHPNVATGLNNLASLLRATNRLAEAEPLFQRALAITEKNFGPDHPSVVIGLHNLAWVLKDTNRLAEAEPLFRRALAITEKSFGPDHPNVATGLNDLALLLSETNQLAEAEPLFRRSLAITEKSFGPDHPNVATGLNNLALLLSDTNQLAEAEPLFRRSLAITEKSFGPDHPNVARGLNNLAGLLRSTNRLAEAEPFYRRALTITEKSFSPDHPNVAMGLNNLASLLRATNRLAEAEPLFRRALVITEKSFGLEHPNVATGLNNLALLLSDTNRLAEAEPLCRRALAMDEKSFGPDHPNVARGLNNLALLLRDTNRLDEAESLFRRALAITEKSFGPDHPNVAVGLNNLGLLLSATNRLDEAEPLFRRALAITETSFAPDHPSVARCLNNLAGLLRDTNRLAEAEPLFRRSLAADERSFGPDHPNVAIGLNNLAWLLKDTNRLAEAEPLFWRALTIDEKSFGPDHPNVARGLSNLALLLKDTDRLAEAELLFHRALSIDEKSFGPGHLDVTRDLNNLAWLLKDTNRLAEAEPLFRRALAIREKILGPEHPDVATNLNNLAWLLKDTDRHEEAESLFRRALSIDEKNFGPDYPIIARDLNNLAWLLEDTNRLAQAEPLFELALAIWEKALGPDHPHVATCLESYAILLRKLGRPEEAEALEARTQAARSKNGLIRYHGEKRPSRSP
jgi:tetratricopeptide (TPR) repeat protein